MKNPELKAQIQEKLDGLAERNYQRKLARRQVQMRHLLIAAVRKGEITDLMTAYLWLGRRSIPYRTERGTYKMLYLYACGCKLTFSSNNEFAGGDWKRKTRTGKYNLLEVQESMFDSPPAELPPTAWPNMPQVDPPRRSRLRPTVDSQA